MQFQQTVIEICLSHICLTYMYY